MFSVAKTKIAAKKSSTPVKKKIKKIKTSSPPKKLAVSEKQPKSLSIFFLTEMWERYGFYALQGTMAFFLIQKFGFSDVEADIAIGTFLALIFISPILGGIIADRFLGFRHSIILGGILLFFSYALLAIAGNFFTVALLFGGVAAGTGLLKANVSSLLGQIYHAHDSRRDSGFTIFYVGINTGSLLAMGLSGYIVEYLSWGWNFSIAAMGMILSVASFVIGMKTFNIQDPHKIKTSLCKKGLAYLMTVVFIVICATLLRLEGVATWAFITAVVVSGLALIYAGIGETPKQKRRLMAFTLLAFLSCLFWAIFNQMFISFNLFIDRAVNPNIFGLHLPAPVFMAFEAVGVIVFGSLFSQLWIYLSKTRFHPSTPTKFSISFLLIGLALAFLLIGLSVTNPALPLSPFWILGFYLMIAFGELCISPIGFAMATRIATPRLAGMMMGIWLFTIGIGGKIAGYIATLAAIPNDIHDLPEIRMIYGHAFVKFFWIALAAFILALLFIPIIRYLISGRLSGLGTKNQKMMDC